jgi:hypothetical protein
LYGAKPSRPAYPGPDHFLKRILYRRVHQRVITRNKRFLGWAACITFRLLRISATVKFAASKDLKAHHGHRRWACFKRGIFTTSSSRGTVQGSFDER